MPTSPRNTQFQSPIRSNRYIKNGQLILAFSTIKYISDRITLSGWQTDMTDEEEKDFIAEVKELVEKNRDIEVALSKL